MNEATPPADLEADAVRTQLAARMFGATEAPPKIGRYVIERRIGSGGLGVVYAALDPDLDRHVAVKLVRPDRLDGSRGEIEQTRLWREAKALAKLTHPHVVHVYEVGIHDDRVFVAMQLVEGSSLREWLDERHAWRAVLDVFLRAGRGLAAAHGVGVIHRDFKPDNVLVDGHGSPYVVDFGLAHSSDLTTTLELEQASAASTGPLEVTSLTKTGGAVGTPAYMAPEQFRGDDVDARTDVFSFCVALYEALYQERPFPGSSVSEVAANVVDGRRRKKPTSMDVPDRLYRVVDRGLSLDPGDRPASMEELLEQLEADPGRRRRRLALGGFVGAGAIGLLALAGQAPAIPAKCEAASDKIAEAWSDAMRNAGRESFLATDLPYAEQAWKTLATRLDGYAGEWVSNYTEACEATHVRGEQSSELLDHRMACLERRRSELAALTALLPNADAKLVEKSGRLTDALTSISRCDASNELLAALPPPPTAVAADVERIRGLLDEVKTLGTAGRFSEALPVAERAAQEADALAYEPLQAEARLAHGRTLSSSGEPKPAIEIVKEALYHAEATGHDEVAAYSLILLVELVGQRMHDFEEGEALAQRADAAVRRMQGDELVAARLENTLGLLYVGQADWDKVLEHFGNTLEIRARVLGPEHLLTGQAHNNVGLANLNAGHFEDGLKHLEEALRIKTLTEGESHPDTVMSLVGRGNAWERQGDFAKAVRDQSRALELQIASLGPDHPSVGNTRLSLSNSVGGGGDLDGAEVHAREAHRIFDAALGAENPTTARALVNLSGIQRRRGDFDGARETALQAVDITKKVLPDPHPDIAVALYLLGQAQNALGQHTDAEASLRPALGMAEKTLGNSHSRAIQMRASLAAALVDLGRPKEALELLEPSIQDAEDADAENRGRLDFELARALWASAGDRARARELAAAAHESLSEAQYQDAPLEAAMSRWLDEHPLP